VNELLGVLNLRAGQTIVSIGTGGGVWEIGLGAAVDGLTMYLVELDPALLNEAEISAGVRFFERQYKRPVRSTFVPVIGTATEVPLPDGLADQVLLLNSLHEFTEPAAMLRECARLLRPGGYLWIEETLARYPGERHAGCGRYRLSQAALVAGVEAAGFSVRRSHSRDGGTDWLLFECIRSRP
jgi:ubiquinone/menaquinone biosynthesis C-methylase UbiE